MTIDVIDLRDFYSRRLGVVARRLINRGIQARWPNAAGQRVLGIGYPTPYLGLFPDWLCGYVRLNPNDAPTLFGSFLGVVGANAAFLPTGVA